MDLNTELKNFISRLDDDLPFSSNKQMNEIWNELEEYMDKAFFDIDKFVDDLFPTAQPLPEPKENDFPTMAEPSAQFSIEELLKSVAMRETFFNDLVRSPVLDFTDQNFVPTEVLLNSIRAHKITINCQQYEHPFSTISFRPVAHVAPFRNDFIADFVKTQQPYPGITADEMVENIMRRGTKSQMLPKREDLFTVIDQLVKDLSIYIDRLAVEFKDHKFYDTVQFDYMSRRIQEQILSDSSIKSASLRDILLKWMGVVAKKFAHLNEQRSMIETKVSERVITEAVEVYVNQGKQIDCVLQGVRRVYSNCEDTFIANVMEVLNQRLKGVNSAQENQTISSLVTPNTVSGVSFAGQNVLKERLTSIMARESNNKGAEFEQRSSHEVSEPSAPQVSPTRSPSVGIHFGFETLTVSCFNPASNNFRHIYGPVVNVVSFARQGVFIGEMLACSLNMENVLKNQNVDLPYDTDFYGKLKLDAIIALVLMSIDELVKQSLHTRTGITYAIAIPSCLNEVIQHSFTAAINIADINGFLVREHCALTTNFIRENHTAITKNKDELLMTMIEHPNKACDSVIYEITGKNSRTIQVFNTSGSETASRLFGFMNNTGFQCELEKMKSKCDQRNRFLICSADQENNVKDIKLKFCKSKVHPLKFDSTKIADGAALLSSASIGGKSNLECSFDIRHLTSIKRLTGGESYRLKHISSNGEPQNLTEISIRLRSLIDNQLEELATCKAATKQFLMGTMKDLEESHLSEDRKKKCRQELQDSLGEVEKASTNKLILEKIDQYWSIQF